MNVLESLAVLGILILIHEAGHFFAARSQGIHVNGFSIGFGPALIKWENEGITYALRALPLGGFVSFPDDDKESNIPPEDPDLLSNRPIHQRAFVISAGVLANFLLAWVVLIGQSGIVGIPDEPSPGVMVLAVQHNEAAEKAGLTSGDRILSIDGQELGKGQEAVQLLIEKIKGSPEKTLAIEKISEEKKIQLTITPANQEGSGMIGAQLQPNSTGEFHKAKDIFEVFNKSSNQFLSLLNRTVNGYKGLLTEFSATAQQLSGPVKIVEIGAQLSGQGISGLTLFAALISINLAVLNSLPLPLLDGGQLMLLIIEGILGRPVPENLQIAFMQSGFVLIVGLSVVLIIKDTSQLSIVQGLIGH